MQPARLIGRKPFCIRTDSPPNRPRLRAGRLLPQRVWGASYHFSTS
ncbi:hypothetical protein GQ607_011869 [Colletotrichum asianum]|uniref:Uncharacterized protein n=1 Tax=Colletotrichum asianum TaxID=702518 RepID=A0A8H3W818_9PEZI|nr:hypothetical protein GQ607_011869 [Colletotrichum asianum]